MSDPVPGKSMVRTANGVSLKAQLRRTERMRTIISVSLVAPLILFVVIAFAIPIGSMLVRSVDNPEVGQGLPRTVEAIKQWDGNGLPGELVYAALVFDLKAAREDPGVIGRAAKRLNYEIREFRSLLLSSVKRSSTFESGPYKQALVDFDSRWGEAKYWAMIKRNAAPYTDFYVLTAIDRKRDMDGNIVPLPLDEAIFVDIAGRTLWISVIVTFSCLFLGYPVAYLMAVLPSRISNLLMFFVLLPFWTALLVRTTAWIVLLQRQGLINQTLIWLGVLSTPLDLIFNRPGMLIAMTHVLLPYMILPLYSVMKGIDPQYMRAAQSLGASPTRSFWKVYVPQTLPGISAGCMLVFILALGYYVTPQLVGGAKDQMLSSFIAFYTHTALNWGLASALAALLLMWVMIFYFAYHRVVGLDTLKPG